MKIGGYSHFNGITFFCDNFKMKGSKKKGKIKYDIEWIIPPKFLRKLENKFIIGGLSTAYYQWKVLDRKIRMVLLFLIGVYFAEDMVDLSNVYNRVDYLIDQYLYHILIVIATMILLNYKKILQVFRYHGAEHKAINCYIEHGYVDPYLIKKASRFNIRCGSNITGIFLLLYLPLWLFNIESIGIIFLLFLTSIQIIKILDKKKYSWDKYVQLLQWITALEPKEEELDVAVGTFNQLQKAHHLYRSKVVESRRFVRS